jgi:hypothetical protein
MVVVQFYSFYRNSSADTLLENLMTKIEDSGVTTASLLRPIYVPFICDDGQHQDLPEDLRKLLVESLQLRYGHDMNRKTNLSTKDDQMITMETKLRKCLTTHRETIERMAVSLEFAQDSLCEQLLDRTSSLIKMDPTILDGSYSDSVENSLLETAKKIKLVSLDVPRLDIHHLLKRCQDAGMFQEFFDVALKNAVENDGLFVEYPGPEFIENTHVTMAFAGRKLSAKSLLLKYEKLQGCSVNATVCAFLWSNTHAALEVTVASTTTNPPALDVPPCENSFCHITVWCSADCQAFYTNRLPALIQSGDAKRIPIEPNVCLTGKLSFWNQDNQSFEIQVGK